jgi:hypothetical protein
MPCHHRLSVLAFASSAPYALFSLITCSCFFASRAVLLLPLFFYTKPDGNEVRRHGSTTSRAARTWPRSSRPSPTPASTCTSASDPTSAPSGTTGQQPHLITHSLLTQFSSGLPSPHHHPAEASRCGCTSSPASSSAPTTSLSRRRCSASQPRWWTP